MRSASCPCRPWACGFPCSIVSGPWPSSLSRLGWNGLLHQPIIGRRAELPTPHAKTGACHSADARLQRLLSLILVGAVAVGVGALTGRVRILFAGFAGRVG